MGVHVCVKFAEAHAQWSSTPVFVRVLWAQHAATWGGRKELRRAARGKGKTQFKAVESVQDETETLSGEKCGKHDLAKRS